MPTSTERTRPVLLTFAVPAEARPFTRRLRKPHPETEVLLTGIGQRNARATVQPALERFAPRLVLSCGFAGGLHPALATGTILFAADHPFPLRGALESAGARPARFHCVNRIIASAAAKRRLHKETGADAVEMESGVIRELCRAAQIPSATVRVISDGVNENLPLDFNRYLDEMDRIRFARMAATVLFAPSKIRALVQFQRQVQSAAQRLADLLLEVIRSVPPDPSPSSPSSPPTQ